MDQAVSLSMLCLMEPSLALKNLSLLQQGTTTHGPSRLLIRAPFNEPSLVLKHASSPQQGTMTHGPSCLLIHALFPPSSLKWR